MIKTKLIPLAIAIALVPALFISKPPVKAVSDTPNITQVLPETQTPQPVNPPEVQAAPTSDTPKDSTPPSTPAETPPTSPDPSPTDQPPTIPSQNIDPQPPENAMPVNPVVVPQVCFDEHGCIEVTL